MSTNTIKVLSQQASKPEAEWASSNPILLPGQLAFSSDKNGMYKLGDGTNSWSGLSYNNAFTVNGHAVSSDVPDNAKFTDTVYIHPPSHPAAMITEDGNRQFVTEEERAGWNESVQITRANNSSLNHFKFFHFMSQLGLSENVSINTIIETMPAPAILSVAIWKPSWEDIFPSSASAVGNLTIITEYYEKNYSRVVYQDTASGKQWIMRMNGFSQEAPASGEWIEQPVKSDLAGYLPLAGGMLTGDLLLSGTSILPTQSGVSAFGSPDRKFNSIYIQNGYFDTITKGGQAVVTDVINAVNNPSPDKPASAAALKSTFDYASSVQNNLNAHAGSYASHVAVQEAAPAQAYLWAW